MFPCASNNSRDPYEVARERIQEIIESEIEPEENDEGSFEIEGSLNDQELHTLANRLIQFIQKCDRCSSLPAATRVHEFLQEASWYEVGGQWTLMFPKLNLGQGGECIVYRGLTSEGIECAVKAQRNDPKSHKWMEYQTKLYDAISSPSHGIIKRYASSEWHDLEEVCTGNLKKMWAKTPKFVLDHLTEIDLGILKATAHIHSKDYVYSDFKSENILLTENGEVRINDFGHTYPKNMNYRGGTHVYWAPEQVQYFIEVNVDRVEEHPLPHAQMHDIWQAMIILADINAMHLSEPFRERFNEFMENQQNFAIDAEKDIIKYAENSASYFNDRRKVRDGLFSDLQATTYFEKLLMHMAMFDPEKRISAADALAYFKEFGVLARI